MNHVAYNKQHSSFDMQIGIEECEKKIQLPNKTRYNKKKKWMKIKIIIITLIYKMGGFSVCSVCMELLAICKV